MFKDKEIWKQELGEAVQILTKLYPVFILLYLFDWAVHFIWSASWLSRVVNFWGLTFSFIGWGLIVLIPFVAGGLSKTKKASALVAKEGLSTTKRVSALLANAGLSKTKIVYRGGLGWLKVLGRCAVFFGRAIRIIFRTGLRCLKILWAWFVWFLALLWRALGSIRAWWLADRYRLSIVLTVLLVSIYLKFTLFDSLVALFATITFLFDWDSRISAFLAMVFLVACPFLLGFGQDALAEASAVYAYYFLVVTVAVQIWDLARGNK